VSWAAGQLDSSQTVVGPAVSSDDTTASGYKELSDGREHETQLDRRRLQPVIIIIIITAGPSCSHDDDSTNARTYRVQTTRRVRKTVVLKQRYRYPIDFWGKQ